MGKVAAALGTPLMPWQRQVADTALEVDARGRFVYQAVIVSVPRQSGKTTLDLANAAHRCLYLPDRRVWHTAQTGMDARDKVLEALAAVQRSPLGRLLRSVKRGAGHTCAEWVNGSELRPFAPMVDALHGRQSDLVTVDEPWAFNPAQGDALQQAIIPTQATRPGAQTWYTSTMGDATSTWWHNLIDTARDEAPPGVAVFEWGIGADDDPTDLDVVAAHHPAIGQTIEREALESAAAQMTPDEFARAYGNRRTNARTRVIPLDVWNALRSDAVVPPGAVTAFGAAIAADRSRTAIVAAADIDGQPLVVVIDSRPGTSWAYGRLAELVDRYGHEPCVAIDRASPAATLWDECDQAQLPLLDLGTRDVAAATGDLLDRIRDRRIAFRADAELDAAVDAAALRRDMRMWDRDRSTAPIPELEAATLAVWALAHRAADSPLPAVRFAS